MIWRLITAMGSLYFLFVPKKKLNKSSVKHILIFKIGAIGDTLMSTPLVRALRKGFPDAQITYMLGSWSAPILANNTNVDRVVRFDEKMIFSRDWKRIRKLIEQIKQEKYDLAFVLDKHFIFPWIIYKAGVPVRVGFNRNGEGFANTINVEYRLVKHEIGYYVSLARAVGVRSDGNAMDLEVTDNDKRKAGKVVKGFKRCVAIAPGGADNPGQSMPSRRWSTASFIDVAEKLNDLGYKVVIVGGKGDRKIASRFGASVVDMAGKLSLTESAALIKKCDCVICNDSGLMHISAAMGVKTVSIFGPTNPRRKAPLTEGSIFLSKKRYKDYEDDGFHPYDGTDYINKIRSDEVVSAVKRIVGR